MRGEREDLEGVERPDSEDSLRKGRVRRGKKERDRERERERERDDSSSM